MCEFFYYDRLFRICGVYALNRDLDRSDFFYFVIDVIDFLVLTIICGDFNVVFDRVIDYGGLSILNVRRNDSVFLFFLFYECCVLDVWCIFYFIEFGFTWSSLDGFLLFRIDYFGCFYLWVFFVLFCDIYFCFWSDYCVLFFSFFLSDFIFKGFGRWYLNIFILLDFGFRFFIVDFWFDWKSRKFFFDFFRFWWDLGKVKFKSLVVRFCN